MGIQGGSLIKLCTLLAWACDFSELKHSEIVSEGETPSAVIDGNCWIYECACGLVSGLTAGAAAAYAAFLKSYMVRIAYVRKCGWTPIIVFDGRSVPIKRATNDKRAARRKKAAVKAKSGGRTSDLSSFKPTHKLVHRLVLSLREAGETVFVAPHEGDPQCAYLANTGKAHVVITRDSDLIAHECKCIFFWNSVYKAAFPGGFGGKFYWKPSLWRCAKGLWKPIIKLGWDSFLSVCVIAGTDYNVGVYKVGIKKAVSLIAEHGTLEAVVSALSDPARAKYRDAKVPEGFLVAANKAKLMFKHPLVFDPYNNIVCHARDLPADSAPLIEVGSPNWMGRIPESREEAIALSRSELHPETLAPYPPVAQAQADETATVSTVKTVRRTSRRPVPNKLRPYKPPPRPSRRPAQREMLSDVEWNRLLNQHGIYFDVPQVLSSVNDCMII